MPTMVILTTHFVQEDEEKGRDDAGERTYRQVNFGCVPSCPLPSGWDLKRGP